VPGRCEHCDEREGFVKDGIFSTDEEPLGCEEGLNFIELINYLVKYLFWGIR
jgi:hypothetical protein